MLETLRAIFESDSLSPHGICLLWRPELIWTHVISDVMIGMAYFSIPLALISFLAKRNSIEFTWVFWCFGAFILACGTTHFFSVWTIWNPDYGVEAIIKAVTAAVSVATAVALWPLIPRAVALPSPVELRTANMALAQNIAERNLALESLALEMSERERTEAMLHQSQKMEAIGQLTGGVAHDFNNLMTGVLMNLDRISRAAQIDPAYARSLHNAIAGAERAAALTQQLLSFARQQPLQPSEIDVNEAILNFRPLLMDALGLNCHLTFDLATDLPKVFADQHQLETVLINLAVNANHAMTNNGQVNISTSQATADGNGPEGVLIRFEDNGEGMTADVKARAFEPFFTTKRIGQGSGLGLSQVYGFAEQTGGNVVLESEPGKGTAVLLRLPVRSKA